MSDLYQDGRAIISRPGNGPVLSRGVPSLAVDGGALGAAVRVPMLDAQAAGMPGRAMAAGGAALGEASDAMGQLAAAQLRMVNERRVYEAEAAMDEMRSTIAARLVNEPDETKWGDIAETEAEAARGVILTDDLSPDARDEIGSRFTRWKAQTVGQTRIESARESRRRLMEVKQAEVIRATYAGNVSGAEENIDNMVSQGLLPADDGERMKIQAREQRKRLDEEERTTVRDDNWNRFTASVEENPWEAREAIDKNFFPDFDEADKARARATADQAISRKQRDVLQQVRDGIIAGAPDTDETGIEQWAATARLGAEDIAGLKEFRTKLAESKAAAGPMDRARVAALFGKIRAYSGDEKTDPQAAQWGALVQEAEVLTAGGGKEGDLTRGALMQSIYGRHPFQERKEAEIPEGIERLFIANIEAVAKDGGFGVEAYKVQQKRGLDAKGAPVFLPGQFEEVPNPAAAVRRIQVQTQLWDALRADYKANPDKWLDPGYLDEWLFGKDGKTGRIGAVKAGGVVEKMRAGGSALPGPDGSLFPGIPSDIYGDPTAEELDNILTK